MAQRMLDLSKQSDYQEYLTSLNKLSEDESTIYVQLGNIIDPAVLLTLGIIKDPDDVAHYTIDGRTLVRLTIKFKPKKKPLTKGKKVIVRQLIEDGS